MLCSEVNKVCMHKCVRIAGSCHLHRNSLLQVIVFFRANTLIRYRNNELLCAYAQPLLISDAF